MRVEEIINEVKELRTANHRSALQVVRLLDSNRKLFTGKIDLPDFNFIIKNFESLADTAPKDYNSPAFKRDFETAFESLLFHLNKII